MAGKRGPYAKSAASREAIVEAAVSVFARSGYGGGSLRDIAEQVGMTEAALRYYFPSKRDLLAAVLELRDDLALDVSPLDLSDPVEALRGLVRLARYNASIPGIIAMHTKTSAEAVSPDHPAHDYYARRYASTLDRFTQAFQGCASIGVLKPDVNPVHAAKATVALMDGYQIQWLIDPNSIDMAAELNDFLRGLLLPAAGWDRRPKD